MTNLLKNIIRFIFLILIQVLVMNRIGLRLGSTVTPYIYYLFILWLPFNMNRVLQMVLAFLLGFTLDSFLHTPGFHAAACVLIAYLRPFVINILIPQEGTESNYAEPSAKSMGGFLTYTVYAGILTLIHNGWLFFLEAWQLGDVWYFFSKTIFATVINLLLIIVTELLFVRKQKFRTNTI
jgi:rod shape-determining protein MreD